MANISKSRLVSATLDRVWEVVSEVDNEPKYFDGLRSIKNLSKSGNVIEREVVVGFRKSKGRQTVTLKPKGEVEVRMTEGPTIGTRVTKLTPAGDSKTRIDVEWDVEFRVPSFVVGMVTKEIESGTERALERIAAEAEKAEGGD